MLERITFKTELSEIITVEEVAVLFDTIRRKYDAELVSLSLFPSFNQLRKEVIDKTLQQRNKELSKLLAEIANRKQEIKINMWKTLSAIGSNKKSIQNNADRAADLDQIIYEEEQIINVYEQSIRTLERKEKKIMNGKYSRIDKLKATSRKRSLKRQLEQLKENINEISAQHNDCFKEYQDALEQLIDRTIMTAKSQFPKKEKELVIEKYANSQTIIIEETNEVDDNKMHYDMNHEFKDFYLYEPNQEDPDDELIYQLLNQGKYDNEEGTVNGLLISQEFIDYEEV